MSCEVKGMKHAIPAAAGIGGDVESAGDIAQSVYSTETAADMVPFPSELIQEVIRIVRIVTQNLPTKAARSHFVQQIMSELTELYNAHANSRPAPPTRRLRRIVQAVKTLERLNPAIPLDGEPWITTNPIAWTITRKERGLVSMVLDRNGYTPIPSKGFRSTELETILENTTGPSDRNAVREEIVRTLILNGARDEYSGVTRQTLLDNRNNQLFRLVRREPSTWVS